MDSVAWQQTARRCPRTTQRPRAVLAVARFRAQGLGQGGSPAFQGIGSAIKHRFSPGLLGGDELSSLLVSREGNLRPRQRIFSACWHVRGQTKKTLMSADPLLYTSADRLPTTPPAPAQRPVTPRFQALSEIQAKDGGQRWRRRQRKLCGRTHGWSCGKGPRSRVR